MSLPTSRPKLDVSVAKPTPYTFDLGLLLANDPNPLPQPESSSTEDIESSLASVARDGAQSLINQLLTTCPLQSTASGVLLTLPSSSTRLPREKPLPAAKPPTKWEQFAARKGIKPKTREQRRMKGMQFNESTGEWEKKWGYKGDQRAKEKAEGRVQQDWLIELNDQKEAERKEGTTVRGDARRERKERAKRNERKMRKNLRNGEK